MNIAIIGAGFTGLSAAYRLAQKGHTVTIFEKDSQPGGLAIGYKEKGWEWTLEKHYHHWFTNDSFVLDLAKEIHYDVVIKHPKTSVYVGGTSYQLDSPKALMLFPKLGLIERLRMATILGLLRYNPYWKPLERIPAQKFLRKTMGARGYEMLWGSQLKNKMKSYADDVSLVWFWTRINKRTSSLAYPKAGYLPFAQALAVSIKQQSGTICLNTETTSIEQQETHTVVKTRSNNKEQTNTFDKVIVTLPSFLFLKLAPQLPKDYTSKLVKLKGLGATNMIIRLKKQFLTDDTYWLSICDYPSPVMVIVEHTNLMNKKHFNNEHIIYIGNYPSVTDPLYQMTKEETLQVYDLFLKQINPDYKKNIIGYELFKAPFAQPIIPTNYSKMIPPMKTPLKDVYLANIEQVYPWDRGTNYAVELGEKVAALISDSN